LKNPLWQHITDGPDENSAIPNEFYCPITHELMQEPVVAAGLTH